MHPLQFNFHYTSGELCTRAQTLVARIEILGSREECPFSSTNRALGLFPYRSLVNGLLANRSRALDLAGSNLSLPSRQIGCIEIWSSAKVTLDCRYELSRSDLKQVLAAVKTAVERDSKPDLAIDPFAF